VAPLLSEVQAMSGGNSGWHSRYTDDGGGDVLWQDPALVWAEFYSQHMVPPSLAYHALEGILDTDKKGPIIPTPPTPPSPNITRFYCPAPLVYITSQDATPQHCSTLNVVGLCVSPCPTVDFTTHDWHVMSDTMLALVYIALLMSFLCFVAHCVDFRRFFIRIMFIGGFLGNCIVFAVFLTANYGFTGELDNAVVCHTPSYFVEKNGLCVFQAAATIWFFMWTNTWSAILAVDTYIRVCMELSKKTLQRLKYAYLAVGIIIPSIIVAIPLSLRNLGFDPYASVPVCLYMISQNKEIFWVSFVLPFYILLLIAIVFTVLTGRRIHNVLIASKYYQRSLSVQSDDTHNNNNTNGKRLLTFGTSRANNGNHNEANGERERGPSTIMTTDSTFEQTDTETEHDKTTRESIGFLQETDRIRSRLSFDRRQSHTPSIYGRTHTAGTGRTVSSGGMSGGMSFGHFSFRFPRFIFRSQSTEAAPNYNFNNPNMNMLRPSTNSIRVSGPSASESNNVSYNYNPDHSTSAAGLSNNSMEIVSVMHQSPAISVDRSVTSQKSRTVSSGTNTYTQEPVDTQALYNDDFHAHEYSAGHNNNNIGRTESNVSSNDQPTVSNTRINSIEYVMDDMESSTHSMPMVDMHTVTCNNNNGNSSSNQHTPRSTRQNSDNTHTSSVVDPTMSRVIRLSSDSSRHSNTNPHIRYLHDTEDMHRHHGMYNNKDDYDDDDIDDDDDDEQFDYGNDQHREQTDRNTHANSESSRSTSRSTSRNSHSRGTTSSTNRSTMSSVFGLKMNVAVMFCYYVLVWPFERLYVYIFMSDVRIAASRRHTNKNSDNASNGHEANGASNTNNSEQNVYMMKTTQLLKSIWKYNGPSMIFVIVFCLTTVCVLPIVMNMYLFKFDGYLNSGTDFEECLVEAAFLCPEQTQDGVNACAQEKCGDVPSNRPNIGQVMIIGSVSDLLIRCCVSSLLNAVYMFCSSCSSCRGPLHTELFRPCSSDSAVSCDDSRNI
jgi:hypothetical protein